MLGVPVLVYILLVPPVLPVSVPPVEPAVPPPPVVTVAVLPVPVPVVVPVVVAPVCCCPPHSKISNSSLVDLPGTY